MKIIKKNNLLRKELSLYKNKFIGFVPTMGALHKGHISLIKFAKKKVDFLVVSIFLNPLQFGKNEDLNKYPINLKNDIDILKREKVDLLYFPSVTDVYPNGFSTTVSTERFSGILCDQMRPGHFKGVTTIVNKLFNLISPNIAFFGQKDYQQFMIIKQMVIDLAIPIKLKMLPTVRSKNGLALSSRNSYLSKIEEEKASNIYKSLRKGANLILSGELKSSVVINLVKSELEKYVDKIEYLELLHADDLSATEKIGIGKYLIATAVYVGCTRLIDNIIVLKK